MWLVGFIIILFVFVSAIILPWINQNSIKQLREQTAHLQRQIDRLKTDTIRPAVRENIAQETRAYEKKQEEPVVAFKPVPQAETVFVNVAAPEKPTLIIDPALRSAYEEPEEHSRNLEQQFGGKAFVWLGGIALALAGFFMVKYSIETGLLSPGVRVVLGLLFGGALLGAGNWVRSQPRIANGIRIAQALSGAGIADLYACLFAATTLYGFVPSFVGFAAMAAVTALAVVLSLRQGAPIAVLGLVGGFLTPALIDSASPSAPLLFLYLYFVLTGLMVVIRSQRWWPMAAPVVLGAFLWVVIWLFGGHFVPDDALWLGLFLIAISVTTIAATRDGETVDDNDYVIMPSSIFDYLVLGGATGLMGLTAAQGGFGTMEWGLFGLISAGGIGLAAFDQRRYGLVPYFSLAVNLVMLSVWNSSTPQEFAIVTNIFAALYIVGGWYFQLRSRDPLLWAGIVGASSIAYYLIGYYDLHSVTDAASFWGVLAFGLAVLAVLVLQRVMLELADDHPRKEHLLAIYAGLASAFIAIGLTVELQREFLSVAFAAEMMAVAWINTRLSIKALRPIVMALACAFGFMLIPQILLLVQLTAYSLLETELPLQSSVPIVNWPLFQLGLPAIFFGLGSYFLRQREDDRLVRALEIAAVALTGVMGYYLMRHAFHAHQNVLFVKAGIIERGAITNAIFVFGLICLFAGPEFGRSAVTRSGMVLAGVALFRIFYFDLVICNPLWSAEPVGTMPILNGILLTYGLPVIWAGLAQRRLAAFDGSLWSKVGKSVMLLLAFIFLSLNVRHFYHGTFLNGYATTDAEIYTYSAVWMLFGIALLFAGTLRQDRMIRAASLVVLLMTVGKVFLYDASELTGLWRVFSFFGLGLSLLGLSWFYSRFVFMNRGQR